jgi:hypothetical protein
MPDVAGDSKVGSDTGAAPGKNGKGLTLAQLAEAKRLPVDFLQGVGLHDLAGGGVGIPYFCPDGARLTVKRRTALQARAGSYWPKGMPLAAYGQERLDRARREGRLFLPEGESDCWALWYHDFPALGLPGSNTAPALEAEHLVGIQDVYVSREPDRGGTAFVQGVARRLAELGYQGRAWELRMPEGIKDPADLHAAGPGAFAGRLAECVRSAAPMALPSGPEERSAAARPGKKKGSSQADVLLRLAEGPDYFHAPDGQACATVPLSEDGRQKETMPVRSESFRDWLRRRYYRATGRAPSGGILHDVLGALTARARFDGPLREVPVRVGGMVGTIYLDLCDDARRAVAIDRDGWRLVSPAPVRFRRSRGEVALAEPVRGGALDELRPFVNVSGEDDWRLAVAWLAQALNPSGPYPLLCLHGEQGSAKSTTARALKHLLDPTRPSLRAEPKDERDLIIGAGNGWVYAMDNLSHLQPWMSDALCRLATGGGFATRQLYSDDEEAVFDVQRPVLLNGIEDLASRPDLLDRAIVLSLPPIEDNARMTERTFWARFEGVRPRVLGALLDAVSGALRLLGDVEAELREVPRMADFAVWAEAVGRALGWPACALLEAYRGNREAAATGALDASILTDPLRAFLAEQGLPWEGTFQALLEGLAGKAGTDKVKERNWPRTPRGLSGMLRRLAPALRKSGVAIQFPDSKNRQPGGKRDRLVTIARAGNSPATPSRPSRPSPADDGEAARQDAGRACAPDSPGEAWDGRGDGCGTVGTNGTVPPQSATGNPFLLRATGARDGRDGVAGDSPRCGVGIGPGADFDEEGDA